MLKVSENKIMINRGDVAVLGVKAKNQNGTNYTFKPGDVIRFKVMGYNECEVVELEKDVIVEEESSEVDIYLSSEDTTIGEVISMPTNYWYEIELNPDTFPQTIVGYDEKGPKLFILYPEGGKTE